MNTDKTGGSAFPVSQAEGDDWFFSGTGGMTLRDYFAAKAMQACLADPECTLSQRGISVFAYEIAGHMLAVREVQP